MNIHTNIQYSDEEHLLVINEHLATFTHLYKWAGSTHVFFTSLTAFMFYGLIDSPLIGVWLALHWINTGIQTYVFNLWKKTDFNEHYVNSINKFKVLFLLSIFFSGVLWGLSLLTLNFQEYPTESIYLCIYTFGAISASVVMGSYWIASFLCYSAPLYLMGSISFVIGVPETSWYSAIAMIVFFGYMVSAIISFHKNNVENTIHKYRNKNLAVAYNKERQKSDDLAKSRANFLAVASHDIRQPLQALNLLLSTLEHDETNDKNSEILVQIEESTDSLNDLLNHILDISKLESNQLVVNIEPCSLDKIASRVIRQFNQKAKKKNIQLINEIPDLWCLCDPILLERILSNLIGNAINYTQSGSVRLFQRQEDKKSHITVKDTGIGISEAQQQHIFDEFYQVSNQIKGVGLGLSIIKRLCDSLNIPLSVKSSLDQGSEFSITLPIVSETFKKIEASPLPQVLTLDNVRVAVIDDNEQILLGLSNMLEHWGMKVISACSSDKMIDLLRKSMQEPDIIISDYRLADNKNGLDAIDSIKQLFENEFIPSFIISGETNPEHLKPVKENGVTLIHKPVKPSQIRATIQRMLYQPINQDNVEEMKSDDLTSNALNSYMTKTSNI